MLCGLTALSFLASASFFGQPSSNEAYSDEIDIIIDDFATEFFATQDSIDSLVITGNVAKNFRAGGAAFIGAEGSLSWTDTGAGIYGSNRQVTVDNYAYQTPGSDGNWVIGQINGDNQISYSGGDGVRADYTLSYNLGESIDLATNKYLAFDLHFDEQASSSTRAQVTFYSGATSTTAEIGFSNASSGMNSIDLTTLDSINNGWDATTWSNISSNITDVTFRFFSTSFGDDFRFASKGFAATAIGDDGLSQIPEPTSLILLGALVGGGLLRSPRRGRA